MEIIRAYYECEDPGVPIFVTVKDGNWKRRIKINSDKFFKHSKEKFNTIYPTDDQWKEILTEMLKNKLKPMEACPNINKASELTKYFFTKYLYIVRNVWAHRGLRFNELEQIVKTKDILTLIEDFEKDGRKFRFPCEVDYKKRIVKFNVDILDTKFKYYQESSPKEKFTVEGMFQRKEY